MNGAGRNMFQLAPTKTKTHRTNFLQNVSTGPSLPYYSIYTAMGDNSQGQLCLTSSWIWDLKKCKKIMVYFLCVLNYYTGIFSIIKVFSMWVID